MDSDSYLMNKGVISDNRRIVKNTIYLYLRMGFNMCISFFTAGVVLRALGVEDYGLQNVVGSVAVMFCFLNSSLSGCTSRFISVELGRKGDVQKVFSTCMSAHLFIAFIVFLLGETVGLWFLEKKLVIPETRMMACRIVYQLSLLNTMLGLTQVPYNASIMAYEKMGVFAAFNVIMSLLQLTTVYLLLVLNTDRLIAYSIMGTILAFVSCLSYRIYCTRYLPSCRFRLIWDWPLMKPMLKYTGWDFYGNASVMARTQGLNMLLNIFFTAAMNAANGVAGSVQGAVIGFGRNVMAAIRPQIFKSYAAGNLDRCCTLIYKGTMFVTVLMMLLIVPLEIEMEYVLKIWFKNPPEYAAMFSRMVLIYYLIGNNADMIQVGIHATGRIKYLSLVNGTLFLLVIPFSYFMFRNGAQPYVAYLYNIVAMVIGLVFVSFLFHRYTGIFSAYTMLVKHGLRLIVVGTLSLLCGCAVQHSFVESSLLRLVSVSFTTSVVIIVLSFAIVFDKDDRRIVLRKVKQRIQLFKFT